MPANARAILLTLALLCGTADVHAARVKVEINGLNEEQRDAIRASLALSDYEKRDLSAAQLRTAYKEADEQIRLALEPFGYYDVQVTRSLTGDEASGWLVVEWHLTA